MNEPKPQDIEIECLLKKAHLLEPTSALRDCVMAAAGQAWNQTAGETPWQIPLRRLVLSAAATFLIVSAANHFSSRLIVQIQPSHAPTCPAMRTRDANDDLLGTGNQDTLYRWGTVWPNRRLPNGQTVREHTENLNRMLDALNHNGT